MEWFWSGISELWHWQNARAQLSANSPFSWVRQILIFFWYFSQSQSTIDARNRLHTSERGLGVNNKNYRAFFSPFPQHLLEIFHHFSLLRCCELELFSIFVRVISENWNAFAKQRLDTSNYDNYSVSMPIVVILIRHLRIMTLTKCEGASMCKFTFFLVGQILTFFDLFLHHNPPTTQKVAYTRLREV